jgi:UDP-2-acetamido-2,6-beta-L-arabino-hexul-4-ose reductase
MLNAVHDHPADCLEQRKSISGGLLRGSGWEMRGIEIRSVTVKSDARGCVFEPLSGEDLQSQKNVHVVLTLPGEVRGNHLHRKGTEVLVVHGPALVRHRAGDEIVDTAIAEGDVVRFMFPPGVPHAIQHTGDRPGFLVAFSSEVHDPSNPDTVWTPLIETRSTGVLKEWPL